MQPHVDPRIIANLNGEIDEYLVGDAKVTEREKAARRIEMTIAGIAHALKLNGEVKKFGSFSNGFKTGGSDLDIVFSGALASESHVSILSDFAKNAEAMGYDNITKIFSANVPLVKLTDRKSLMEVDLCINNDLGVRNSILLRSYNEYDGRVLRLGRVVKDWAKKHELVGTADGMLNSYAYMLLVLSYLQQLSPPVVPNLQALATESVPIADHKWGCEDIWETQFLEDVASLPPSTNTQSVGDLLIGFFHFYTRVFEFRKHAVCMRRCGPGIVIDKFTLTTPTNDEQWYVEDPFDLKHNLAGKCSRAGRKRILEEMTLSLNELSATGSWKTVCPDSGHELFFLKCRVSQGVTPQAMLEEFEEFDLDKLHFPKPENNGRMGQAFLEFSDSSNRRRAHTKNEVYVADCQMQLHYSSHAGLAEAVGLFTYSTYEMASYKMKKQILAGRAANSGSQAPRPDMPLLPQAQYPEGPHMMPPHMMPQHPPQHPGAVPPYPGGMPPYGFPPQGMPRMPYPNHLPPHPGYHPGWDPAAGMPPMRQAVPQKLAEQPIPKTNAKAEAKSKAAAQAKSKEKAQPTKTKNQAATFPAPPIPVGSSGWLYCNIRNELPKDKPLFTPEQAKQVQELEVFFRQFNKTDIIKPKDDHVLIQCQLQNDMPPDQKVLLDHQVGKVKEIQRWLSSRK